jgi:spoIIIJ-associated protein
MNKSVEATGKTIDEAFANAMKELGVEEDTQVVEKVVLEKPKSGFLGIGGTQARVRVSYEVNRSDKAVQFLRGLLERMGSEAYPIVDSADDENIDIRIEGENLGMLIGRRGETLNAIQHITNYIVNRGEEGRIRVVVDVENYRKKREESLQKLAEKTASKVLKYRRNIALEPMNAYERHIIHSALQEWSDISTFSSGAEPRRCVVISYTPGGVKQERPERPQYPRPQKA